MISTAEDIKKAFRGHYLGRIQDVGLFEFGIEHYVHLREWIDHNYSDSYHKCIFDAFMIRNFGNVFRGFEFKISLSDFLRDKLAGKWKKYLKYCHFFYWVCPEGLIKVAEVESPAGLIWITQEGYLSIRKRPKRRDVDPKIIPAILFSFAARVKIRREDFF